MAVKNGHLALVKWMRAERAELCCDRVGITSQVVVNGHLDMLKWLHADEWRYFSWDEDTMDAAASLEMVEWLHVNRTEGCTTAAMDNAAKRGDFDTLLFLHANRAEGCTVQTGENAHRNQHIVIFEWLVATFPDIMDIAKLRELTFVWMSIPEFTSPLLDDGKYVKCHYLI